MPAPKPSAPTLTTLHRLLKPQGFRKTASLFSRDSSDVVHLIGVQGSTSNTKEESRITVNAAVFVPALVDEESWEPKKPSIWGAHWHARLGYLSPEHTDLWWRIADEGQAAHVAEDIGARVLAYALPALARFPDSKALAAHWETGRAEGIGDFQRVKYLALLRKVSSVENSVG